jgi:hypothetical protein
MSESFALSPGLVCAKANRSVVGSLPTVESQQSLRRRLGYLR